MVAERLLDLVDSPQIYTALVSFFMSMVVGEGAVEAITDAEVSESDTPLYYTDIDVDTRLSVDAEIEEEDRIDEPELGTETEGSLAVRVENENSGYYIEGEYTQSEEESRVMLRIGKEF